MIHFINKKLPGGLPNKTARALLDIENKDYVPIIRDPQGTNSDTEAVFYFPGCGSERLFSQVGLATQAMLWHAGVQTVLPPGYVCCGYPQRSSGQFDKAEQMITDNRVLFHRVANTLNYLDIKTVVVSCGTCYDQLAGYEFDKIFPAAASSTSTSTCSRRASSSTPGAPTCITIPCHTPMKQRDPMKTVKALIGDTVVKADRCCGESARWASRAPTSRPRSASARRRSSTGNAVELAALAEEERRQHHAGQDQDPDQLPELLPGPEPLRRGPSQRPAGSRLHRDRDGAPDPGRELAARLCRAHANAGGIERVLV